MSPYPLLAKVLGDAHHALDGTDCATDKALGLPCGIGRSRAACIPPHIADLLESALDRCQYAGCALPEDHPSHLHDSWSCTYPIGHEPDASCHAFVPLVTP